MAQRTERTGWVGWIYFAGAMLIVTGGLQVISGLVGIFHHTFYAVSSSGLVAFNYTAWGWIDLILGLVVILTGVGIWIGSLLARVIAVFLAILAMLDNLAFISAYPIWSVIGVVVSGLSIYALTMHGSEARYD